MLTLSQGERIALQVELRAWSLRTWVQILAHLKAEIRFWSLTFTVRVKGHGARGGLGLWARGTVILSVVLL